MEIRSVWILSLTVMVLLAIGMITLFSASAFALDAHGDPYFFLKRQSMWLVIGLGACIAVACFDYRRLQGWVWVFYGLTIVLLILCFIPPIGMKINGSWRWINLGFITFQPSELAKLVSIMALAAWFHIHQKSVSHFFKGFFLPGLLLVPILVLIAMETDLGATALIGATAFILFFVAGSNPRYMGPVVLIGFVGLFFLAFQIDERLGRMMAFMNLEENRLGAGMQQYQALIAFGSGGIEGLGLGNGRQKMLYVPYAHTDFIFPMIGEELGLRVTLLMVFLYLVVIVVGGWIAVQARDRFGMLLAFGVVISIALQASVNIGVTTAVLPNTGLPLPFVSYGGSNLVLCLVGVGLLLSIALHNRPPDQKAPTWRPLNLRVIPRL